MGWPVDVYTARDFETNADPLPELVPASFVPHTASHIVHPSVERRDVASGETEAGDCVVFLGSWRRWKPKFYQSVKGVRRLLQFGWGLPVYPFTSVHGWEGASCIWLQHVLASSNRPLCFLSLEADTQHVVHKLMAGRFGHSLLLGNIQEIYNFIRLANSCLMSKDPAARHSYIFSTFLDPEQCRAGCGLQGPYKRQVHWKRRSFDIWHGW